MKLMPYTTSTHYIPTGQHWPEAVRPRYISASQHRVRQVPRPLFRRKAEVQGSQEPPPKSQSPCPSLCHVVLAAVEVAASVHWSYSNPSVRVQAQHRGSSLGVADLEYDTQS